MSVYSLMSDNTAQPVTQDLLDSADMVVNEDGEFLITIDATPTQGRPNHLHTQPGSDWLNIRDVLGDWMTQTPNALRVQRLDSADRSPLSDDELTERGVRRLVDGVFFAYYCSQSGSNMPPNEMQLPVSSALTSGLSNQLGTKANLRLDDDQALVITTTRGGALFRNAVLHDVFSMTLNYWSRTSSLNMTQMAPDSDGRFTLVVAHEDPGVSQLARHMRPQRNDLWASLAVVSALRRWRRAHDLCTGGPVPRPRRGLAEGDREDRRGRAS